MLSSVVEAKISQKLYAQELGKARALLALDLLILGEDGRYVKKAGEGWHQNVQTQICTCPIFEQRHDLAARMEQVLVEAQFAETPQEKAFKERCYQQMPQIPGVICKHLLCANHLAGLIDLQQEYAVLPSILKAEARTCRDAELTAEQKLLGRLAALEPKPKAVVLPPVPVLKVRGLINPQTHIQFAVPVSTTRTVTQATYLMDRLPDGNWDIDGTLKRAEALFCAEGYKIGRVDVPATACQFFKALPETLPGR